MWRLRTAKGQSIPIRRLPASLGSDRAADVVIPHPSVAGRHARLAAGPDATLLIEAEDGAVVGLGTRRISNGRLKHDDVLVLGRVRLTVEAPQAAVDPVPADLEPGPQRPPPAHGPRPRAARRSGRPAQATTTARRRPAPAPRPAAGLFSTDLSQLPWTRRLALIAALALVAGGLAWGIAWIVGASG